MVKRNVNVDFFRVIATLFVITLHVLGRGGVLDNTEPGSTKYWVAWFIEICTYCAVNCFALISGYVMVNKTIKSKNIINLWIQVLFYSLLLTGLFFIFMPKTRSVSNLLFAFLPIIGSQWWYISSYFALFFFIPFLNMAINHISRQTYKKFLIIILIGICCLDCVIPNDAFLLNDGYSAIWLIIMYLFGAYIKKYDLHKKITALKSILGFFGMCILTLLSEMGIQFLTEKIFGQVKFDGMFISYISITILLSSVFLFLFCLNIKINNTISKFICFIAPTTLGVYLIHAHPFVFNNIIKNSFTSFADKPIIIMSLCVIVASLAIFIICSIIELLRIQLFKLMRINKLSEFIEQKLNVVYKKVFKN